jgi:hypothetical protein
VVGPAAGEFDGALGVTDVPGLGFDFDVGVGVGVGPAVLVRVGTLDWAGVVEGGLDGSVDGGVEEALGLVFVVADGNGLGGVVAAIGGFVVGVGLADTDGVVGRVTSGAGARGGVREFPGRPLGALGTISSGLGGAAGCCFALGSRLSTLVLS